MHTLIGLAPSNHGTTLEGLFTLASYFPGASSFIGVDCPACQQQEAGSRFITDLNAGGETVPGVEYTVIESDNDEVVTPYTSAFLARRPTSRTSCSRTSARSTRVSICRCRTTTSPMPTC